MSKSTTKKTESKAPEPMDAGATESKVGTPVTNNHRVCYAGKRLVAEVHDLFPETPVEYGNYDGRNTALDVIFDLTALDATDSDMLAGLLELTTTDDRVAEVLVEDDLALVSFKGNPRTQDSRATFGLSDALDVLSEPEEFMGASA